MTPKPPIGTRLRDKESGRECVVTAHTERGFAYKGEAYSWIPRWGLTFTGEGEIFTDLDWDDWTIHYEVIEPDFDI